MMSKKTKAPAKKASAPKAKAASKPAVKPDTTPAVDAPKDQKNGVTRPGAGTACRKVWNALDVLHVEGNATAANAMQKLPDINPATVRTQTQRWREFNGITRESAKTARKSDKSGAAKAATVVSKTEGAPQAN